MQNKNKKTTNKKTKTKTTNKKKTTIRKKINQTGSGWGSKKIKFFKGWE